MKKLAITFIMMLTFTGCEEYQKSTKEKNMVESRNPIKYFKDDRTGICFAQVWGGLSHGGVGLAEVNCEMIPPTLLNR